jgi:opacity protein-like surface antigen
MITKSILLLAALLAALPAAAQSSRRAGAWEVYIGPVFTDGDSYTFEGGSTARTDTGVGLSLGFAKNLNSRVSVGAEVEWSEQDYRATVQPGPGNVFTASSISGTVESRTLRFFGSYNFSERAFTPYVTGGLGWTYVDTNIPAGLPESFCWYYPWYGTYCATYVPTQTTTKFSYNLGAGVRYDFGAGLVRVGVNSQWIDFGGNYGSDSLIQFRIDVGTKF